MRIKYIRWSTLQQSGSRQLLDAKNYDLILQEQISGSIAFANRPKGQELLKHIDAGKVSDLYVEEFTRLGRNALDVLTTLKKCEEHNVNVHIQNMNLSSIVNGKSNPLFKMISHIFLAIGEQEKELIKERTEMGKIAARQKGVKFGRKAGSNERDRDFLDKPKSKEILKYLKSGDLSIREISKLTEASTTTILKVKEKAVKLKALAA
jgi:DNA invertase Pin-like site-specific DNA recombinase